MSGLVQGFAAGDKSQALVEAQLAVQGLPSRWMSGKTQAAERVPFHEGSFHVVSDAHGVITRRLKAL